MFDLDVRKSALEYAMSILVSANPLRVEKYLKDLRENREDHLDNITVESVIEAARKIEKYIISG